MSKKAICVLGEICPCKHAPRKSSIWTASSENDIDAVKLRLCKDPDDASKLDAYGYTALHYASQHNHEEILKLLLSCARQPDKNSCGATPLHRAAYAGSFECCKLLLEAGASVNALDTSFGDAKTPLQKALERKHDRIVQLLCDAGACLFPKSEPFAHLDTTKDNKEKVINSDNKLEPSSLDADIPSVYFKVGESTVIRGSYGSTCGLCGRVSMTFSKMAIRNVAGEVEYRRVCRVCKGYYVSA